METARQIPAASFPLRRTASESAGVHDVLLIAWVALIAADRIDLLGGQGGFLLTPFLALTPVVAGSELLRRGLRGRPLLLPSQAMGFLALISTLLAVVGASVLVSREPATSAARALLLAAQVFGTTTVIIAAWDRHDLARLLGRGAVAGILLFAAFDLLQVGALLGMVSQTLRLGSVSIDVMPSTYGGFVPRLSGMVADQNRSGIVLLFYGWLVSTRQDRPARGGFLGLIAVLMLATLSRSVAIAALATVVVVVLERRVRRVPVRGLLVLTLFVVAAVTTLLASPRVRAAVGTTLEPLARRLSVDEGSTQVHLTLIGRGVHEGTASMSRVALGLGYGSAYTVLQDVFPGNRYGSFHSLYVTVFAECGVVGLICILLLFGVPLVSGGPYRPLVAGAAVFNLFYQATNDPALWAILAIAWFTIPPGRRRRRRLGVDAAG